MYRLNLSICVCVAVLALAACGKKEAGDGAMGESAAPADAPAAMTTGKTAGVTGPALKAGLWELKTQIAKMPQSITTKICLDEALSTSFTTNAGPMKQGNTNCSDQTITHIGNVIDMSAVCKDGAQTIDTKVRMEMMGDTAYKQTITATFDPAKDGMKDVSTTVAGKWLGACGADMKPGDMVMPGGMKINMADAMKGK
ncbi:DUF3617 family protein [Asticcacaulis sp. AC402]|uniref:DUF3617 domain-containing protein n=1 Tax=Asticcacaulis sp. AC402 TaxID=1282361 RepID=UPI0003C409B5|nr:DUF3617 family protein [Asticcacaulis sp. AC402]ESQ75050.1 hypothetical protein ABAC402_11640 [Asticcacaulis sp. AC402]